MIINEENYYSVNNKGLSQSKIKLYELCPNYMYRACISGEYKRPDNKNFMVGSEVDGILTEIDKKDNVVISPYDDYRKKEAREWRDEQVAIGKIPCKEDEYENIMAIAIAVDKTSIWAHIKKHCKFQEIIEMPKKVGKYFECLYGKLDAYSINSDGICDLYDLKTSVTVDKKKFFLKAKDLGYFIQLKFYSMLLKHKYPEIVGFRYWFVVAEKSEPYRVVVFKVNERLVDRQEKVIEELIKKIANDKEFKKVDASFENAIDLDDPFETVDDMISSLNDEE